VVKLTATPDASSIFTGWSGACSGATCTVTMSADRSVTATFGPRPAFQPDLQIRLGSGTAAGDGVYNTTGAGQTRSTSGKRGTKKVFYFLLQEDGTNTDSVKLTSSGNSAGFKVKFDQAGRSLSGPTGALNVLPVTMTPGGGTVLVRLTITVLSTAKRGVVKTVAITATSSSGPKDLVKAKVKVA
jgi:hypothetical protein